MTSAEGTPSIDMVAGELESLFTNRTARLTERLAAKLPWTLALYVLGGPEQPADKTEAAERIDQLWLLVRGFLEWNFPYAISLDPIVETQPATSEKWAEAACLICRFKERGDSWYCGDKYSESLPELQAKADKKIRKSAGSDKYFREHFQEPIFKTLARLLLEAEKDHRPGEIVGPEPPPEEPGGDGEDIPPPPKPRLPARRALLVGASAILLALLAFAIVSIGGSGGAQTLAPRDLTVSLAASLEDGPGETGSPGSNVDLGTAGGVQELGIQAAVRPVPGKNGRIPPGLRLVVVVPRKSLASESLPLAFLRTAGSSVREVGQQSSDAVTISSPVADRLGLDAPSDFRIQVKRDGSAAWGAPQLLSDKWLACSDRSCALRLPLARFTGDTGEAVRVGFQTLAFDLAEKGPNLVMDMKQRRLGDKFARDGELHVSPGDRVLYSLYLANQGTEAAHNVRARLSLPPTARLIPGSVRAATTGAATPFAIQDNLANGGVTYAKFGAGASAHYTAIAEVSPRPWAASFWLVKSDETHGTEYWDSARTSTER
jgi:hypothetical protein